MIDIKSQIIKPALDLEDLKVVASAEGWKLTDLHSLHFFLRRNFKYRRKITITEQSGSDLTDYQVLIELNSTNFNFEHVQTNGEDIRFIDADGNLLPYWIEEWDSVNKKAKVWVKVPSIPANGSTEIWMYYGNPTVSSAEDPYTTFDFFNKHGEDGVYSYKKLKKIANAAACQGYEWCDHFSVAVHGMLHHPHAIYVPSQNKIFFAWQGADENWNYEGDPFISYFNLSTKTWATPVRIGTNPTWTRTSPPDEHGRPVMWIDQDGYIHVLCGGHGVDIKHFKSQSPYDISSWSEGTFCSGACGTYPKVFWEGNTIYVFRRGGIEGCSLTLRKSTDGGNTWGSDTCIVSNADNMGTYWWGFKKNGKIHFFASDTNTWRRVYYFYFDLATEKCYRVDGSELSVPFTATDLGYIYEKDTGRVNIMAGGGDVDENGNPYAIVEVTDDTSTEKRVPCWHIALKWNGSAWQVKDIPNSTSYRLTAFRLLNVKSANDIDAYIVLYDTEDRGRLCKFHSNDGLNYTLTEIITDYFSETCMISPVVNMNSECDWNAPLIIVAGCGIDEPYTYASAFGKDFSTETVILKWSGDTAQLESNYTFEGKDCLRLRDESDTEVYDIIIKASFPREFVLEYELAGDTIGWQGCGGGDAPDSWQCVVTFATTSYMRYYYTRDDRTTFEHTNEANRWYSIAIVVKGWSGNVVDVYVDGTKYLSDQPLNTRPKSILVHSVGADLVGNTFVRNIRIRKYTEPEPSVSLGEEETA